MTAYVKRCFQVPWSFHEFIDHLREKPYTLLALIAPALNGIIFRQMALKGSALYVFLWEFDREHLKNNVNKDRRWRGRR